MENGMNFYIAVTEEDWEARASTRENRASNAEEQWDCSHLYPCSGHFPSSNTIN